MDIQTNNSRKAAHNFQRPPGINFKLNSDDSYKAQDFTTQAIKSAKIDNKISPKKPDFLRNEPPYNSLQNIRVESPECPIFSSGNEEDLRAGPRVKFHRRSSVSYRDINQKQFNNRMYPVGYKSEEPDDGTGQLLLSTNYGIRPQSITQVHKRLYETAREKQKSESGENSPWRVQDRRLIQAQAEMSCSFKPQISLRSINIVVAMRKGKTSSNKNEFLISTDRNNHNSLKRERSLRSSHCRKSSGS